jgi:hypothetical protein
MKPDDLFQPLFGSKRRVPARREIVLGGIFCGVLAVASWYLDVSKGGAISFGILAVGCFGLAVRGPSHF